MTVSLSRGLIRDVCVQHLLVPAGTVLTLSDWYHYNSFHAPKAGTPFPNSTLINGLGRYPNGVSESVRMY